MTSITIRTDDDVKNALAIRAADNGMTLSGYVNQILREVITDDDDFISEARWVKELEIAKERSNDPNAVWLDAREAIKDLGQKYGL
jgi:plasmid stability protein